MAQARPAMTWPMARPMPVPVKAKAPPIRAISMKISSPAYMLPNNRRPCESVLEANSMICIAKLTMPSTKAISGFLLVPNGAVTSSCAQPPRPLILTL